MKEFLTRNRNLLRMYLILLTTLLVTWTISLWVIEANHFLPSYTEIWYRGTINHFAFASIISAILLVLNASINNKWVIKLSTLLFILIATFEAASCFYFIITLAPIDISVFEFDPEQMKLIAGEFAVFRWYYVLLAFPLVTFLVLKRTLTFHVKPLLIFSLIMIGAFTYVSTKYMVSERHDIFSRLSKNKSELFLLSALPRETGEMDFKQAITFFQNEENKKFTEPSFPLIHATDTTNPLALYFELTEKPPSLVFILVESLSSSFSGKNADEISYTPFLDSLSESSLYFENMLATGERTFAALPSIFGSLPHGNRGFTHKKYGFPKANTLIRWLSNNGYYSSFFYGGHARFDYMDLFLHDQGINVIKDKNEYDYSGTSLKTSIDSVPFGITDKKLFEEYVDVLEHSTNKAPRLDILLTLSMHYPFQTENAGHYKAEVLKHIEESSVPEKLKEKHRQYSQALSTIVYTDNVLRNFFKSRSEHPDHQNTIYIILGDHMMSDIPNKSPIEKYRAPMMIYSPLLKKKSNVKAVNSQLDIAPSFYPLLLKAFRFQPLEHEHWLGRPFDMRQTFQANRNILFMRNDRSCPDFLFGNYFTSMDELFEVSDRLNLINSTDDQKRIESIKVKSAYEKIHTATVELNKILPDKPLKRITQEQNIFLEISDTTIFQSVYDSFLKKDYSNLEIAFELSLLEGWPDSKKPPLLIFSLTRNNENIVYKKIDLDTKSKNSTQPNTYFVRLKNNLNYEMKKGDELKLYFWNKEKTGETYKALIHEVVIKEY